MKKFIALILVALGSTQALAKPCQVEYKNYLKAEKEYLANYNTKVYRDKYYDY